LEQHPHQVVRQPEGRWHRLRPTRDQLAHLPQLAGAGAFTMLAVQAFSPAAPCDQPPCANAQGGGAAVLPSEFGMDTVPTRGGYEPVVQVPMASAGTIAYRTVWTAPYE
jgi:hypothetical protein